jgi:hypothetical protein
MNTKNGHSGTPIRREDSILAPADPKVGMTLTGLQPSTAEEGASI